MKDQNMCQRITFSLLLVSIKINPKTDRSKDRQIKRPTDQKTDRSKDRQIKRQKINYLCQFPPFCFILKFQGGDLISALGGSLGLFTGMAMIMIFEIFELFFDLFLNISDYLTSSKTLRKKRMVVNSKWLPYATNNNY